MYGTCETLCRELAAQYTENTPLMLVVWSPEEIQALADGMEISLTGHEIRTVLARLEDIPEEQRIESGISSAGTITDVQLLFQHTNRKLVSGKLTSHSAANNTAANNYHIKFCFHSSCLYFSFIFPI